MALACADKLMDENGGGRPGAAGGAPAPARNYGGGRVGGGQARYTCASGTAAGGVSIRSVQKTS